MSHFWDFRSLVLFVPFIIFFTEESMASRENSLFELSSREDLVQVAGYGEEKLSTVLVTGSLHCEACFHGEAELRAWAVSGLS